MNIKKLIAAGRRPGLSAVLSLILLMAMVSTALFAYVLVLTSGDLAGSQANQTRQNQAQTAAQEDLVLKAFKASGGLHNNWLWVEAYNSGNVPATITAVYVTDGSGTIKSLSSSSSPYLVGVKDLNVSLPLTVPVATNTTSMSGCYSGKGCSIGINTAAYSYSGGTVLIHLLTSSGKSYSAQYPMPSGSVVISTTSSASTSTSTAVSTTKTVYTSTTSSIACSSCSTTTVVGQGLPSLLVSLSACPSGGCASGRFVFNGGTITLTANITNVTPQTISNIQLTLSPAAGIPTGTAHAVLTSSCAPTGQSLNGGESGIMVCGFTGYTGAQGGSVTFVGYATGIITGVQTMSAEATSNPVQIGNLVNTGPWSLNYFSYNFESSQQITPLNANYISAGNDHVAWTMTLNNNFNQSLTVLDETFLMNVRLGPDPTFFIVKSFCLPGQSGCGASPAITSYNCYPGSSSAGCFTVPAGGSLTIWLAACPPSSSTSPGSTTWGWSSSGGGGGCGTPSWSPVEGDSVLLVVFYTLGSGTSGAVYSQSLPFQSEIITYSTSMAVSCSPNPIAVGSPSTCTGTVTSTGGSTSPTGVLTFTASPTNGAFSPVLGTCTLSAVSGTQAKCTVQFTPSSPGPFIISASYPGDTLHGPAVGQTTLYTSATLPIQCTMANSAPSATLTLTSTGPIVPTPSTVACDGSVHNVVVAGSANITATEPSGSANVRYLFAGSVGSLTSTACSTGTCSTWTFGNYEQLQNTYKASPTARITFDMVQTITVSGTQLGAAATVCTVSTSNGGAAVSCQGWADYNTAVSFSPTTVTIGANEKWVAAAPTSFTDTTGGNTRTVNYYDQLQNTYKSAPNGKTTFNVVQTITVSGTLSGSAVTICTMATSVGGGAVQCSGWADYNTAASYSPLTFTVSANERWSAASPNSFSDTSGGNTHTVNYWDQLQNTYRAVPSAPATWDAVYSIPVTGTVAGVSGTTGCTITTTSGGGAATCQGWFDYNTAVTISSPVVSGNVRWVAVGSTSFTQTTGGNTDSVNYDRQDQNTYTASPNGSTTWDLATSIPITGTQLGVSGTTICTITTTNGGGAASCTGWTDYNTAASFSVTNVADGANERWMATGATSFTDTTGGNTHTVNYWDQVYNTYRSAPNARSTFDMVQTITISGNQLGAATTICSVATSSGGSAVSCQGWTDYSSSAIFSPTTISVSGNERWSAVNPVSFIDTTGGNTHTVNYFNQLQNTYRATPTSPATWDAAYSMAVTGTVGGTSGTTGCTISATSGGGAASCQAWFDYNTAVTVASTVTSTSDRWVGTAPFSFTQTTGGNTNNVNFARSFGLDPNGSSHPFTRFASGTATQSISISTTNTNDLVFACEYTVNTGLTQSTPTATGLTFAQLGSTQQITTNHGELSCWDASASAALSGVSISFTTSATNGGKILMAFAITGNSLSMDGTIHFNTATSGTSSSVAYSTTAYPDVLVGGVFTASSESSFTAGGSYSLVGTAQTGTVPSGAVESLIVSTAGSQTTGFSWSSTSSYWISFAVAIDPPTAAAAPASASSSTGSGASVAAPGVPLVLASLAAMVAEQRGELRKKKVVSSTGSLHVGEFQDASTSHMYLASLPLIEGAHQKQPNLSMNFVELDPAKSGELAKSLIYDHGSEGGRTN